MRTRVEPSTVVLQDYTNTVCWVSNTYYVPMQTELPREGETRQMISYYQWVPIMLLCQAWLFFMPCLLWRFLNRRVGVNLSAIVEAGQGVQKAIYAETREKTVRYMVLQMDAYLIRQHKMRKGACARFMQTLAHYCFFCCGKFYGNYLTCTYIFIKVLYILNTVAQIFMLDIFLGFNRHFHFYGISVLIRLIEGHDWSVSERFPRVTMCDFKVRQQQNIHNYSLQCVLPINLFNEKIFIFIWFWLLGIILATVVNLIHWGVKTFWLPTQVRYIKRQLRSMDYDKREPHAVSKFTEYYLRRDGVFIVRMVSKNAGIHIRNKYFANMHGRNGAGTLQVVDHHCILRYLRDVCHNRFLF